MRRFTIAALATFGFLTFAPLPVSAQYPTGPIPTPNTSTPSFEWVGNKLRVSPSTAAGCRVEVLRVFLRYGNIFASLRNPGLDSRNLTLTFTLAGSGQNKSGSTTKLLRPGETAEAQLMAPFGGPLTSTTMTLRVAACVQAS